MSPLAQTRDALARGEAGDALGHALEAWRATRATAYAELVHALRARLPSAPPIEGASAFKRWKKLEAEQALLDIPRQVAFLRADTRQKVWREGLDELAKRPPDPVLSRELADCVRTLPWRAPAALDLYRTTCALIAASGTDGDTAPLREALAAVDAIDNAKLRAAVSELLRATIAELTAARPPADASVLAEVHAALARFDRGLAARAARTEELVAAVYANLDDDGPRLVLADHLAAIGDPRGELIALQCQSTPLTAKQQARARQLVEAYGKAWLAALGDPAVMKDGLEFERGFVAKLRVRLGGEPRTIGNRIWSTVRQADLGVGSSADELLDPVCTSLRVLFGVNGAALARMLQHHRALPLEVIGLDYGGDDRFAGLAELGRAILPGLRELFARTPHALGPLRAALEALPPLDRLHVDEQPGPWRDLLGPRLRELVGRDFPFVFTITRDEPATLHLAFGDHGWERLSQLIELPGITRMIITAEPTTCETCKRKRATADELEKRFGCRVELA
ncbi:MAG: TIGR02996 domain-containing protein [Kofleriaceae bacterium]